MTFSSAFGFIYALLKAIPLVEKAVRDFLAFYAIKEREWYYEKLHKAIESATRTGETKPIEHAIGSPRSGKPSGHGDSAFDNPDAP